MNSSLHHGTSPGTACGYMFDEELPNTMVHHPGTHVHLWSSCCCCLPSETYGRNGVTPIFRSFHRTASSTTGGWSHWNILNVFFLLYIILGTTVSYFWNLRMAFFYKVSLFCEHFHFYFFASTLDMCVMYLTSI